MALTVSLCAKVDAKTPKSILKIASSASVGAPGREAWPSVETYCMGEAKCTQTFNGVTDKSTSAPMLKMRMSRVMTSVDPISQSV